VYYYSFNGASTAIPNEIPQTTAAYNYIATLTQQIVLGQTVTALQSVVTQVTNLPPATTAESEDLEDLGLSKLMKSVNKSKKVSRETIMAKLKS
jgi:hypothetical protein